MTIRYLIVSLSLIGISCSGQEQSNQQVQIDTAKLFDPKPDAKDFGSPEMFKNCLLLNQRPYGLIIQGNQFQIKTDKELFNTVQNQKEQIIKSRFYVFVDSSIAFNKIITLIDYLKQSGFDNYRVINFDKYFKPSEPINVEKPGIAKPLTVDINDSSYFLLTILNKNFEVSILNKKKVLKNSVEVDTFIKDNISIIDPNKVLIRGNSNEHYNRFKSILAIFKKYNYYKFKILSY